MIKYMSPQHKQVMKNVIRRMGGRMYADGGQLPDVKIKQFNGNTNSDTNEPVPIDTEGTYQQPAGSVNPPYTPAQSPVADYDYNHMNWTPASKAAMAKQIAPGFLGRTLSTLKNNVPGALDAAAPYASNIINSFRRPPMPASPTLNPQVTLSQVHMDNARNDVQRNISAAGVDADRTVDGNTAAAIKRFDLGTKLDKLSAINESEANTNAGIRNQQAQINAGITEGNNRKLDDYNTSKVERSVAQQREQSMNVANAGEKMMEIKNEKEKTRVDQEKTKVMSTMFAHSGVYNRLRAQWKKMGLEDPEQNKYSDLPSENNHDSSNPMTPEESKAVEDAKLSKKKLGGTISMRKLPAMRALRPMQPIGQTTKF